MTWRCWQIGIFVGLNAQFTSQPNAVNGVAADGKQLSVTHPLLWQANKIHLKGTICRYIIHACCFQLSANELNNSFLKFQNWRTEKYPPPPPLIWIIICSNSLCRQTSSSMMTLIGRRKIKGLSLSKIWHIKTIRRQGVDTYGNDKHTDIKQNNWTNTSIEIVPLKRSQIKKKYYAENVWLKHDWNHVNEINWMIFYPKVQWYII